MNLNISEVEDVFKAIHCCINGPDGVHKNKTVPVIEGEKCIYSVVKCTNQSWRTLRVDAKAGYTYL